MKRSVRTSHGTPLDPEEAGGLLLPHITTREELNYWEQKNITEALQGLAEKKPRNILADPFMRQLHKKMFGSVWAWAGNFRKTEKNIGVPVRSVSVELKKLCDDTTFWIKNKSFPNDEIAARFHHRLTWIHPFPNGNGRHARLMTDLLLKFLLKEPCFTWGSSDLAHRNTFRKRYILALKSADIGNLKPLIEFVRT